VEDMSLFRIESKFIAVNKKEVIQYRRLVTPVFRVKLKPVRWEFGEYFCVIFVISFKTKGWYVDQGKKLRVANEGEMKSIELALKSSSSEGETDRKVVPIR
jgi:hypothetical protein